MPDRRQRADAFVDLHRSGVFLIPNPWDAGSARMLTNAGFRALATTSGGLAGTLGRTDGRGEVSRAECLANARLIVGATPLPVSADLESGYGDTADDVAETIRLAADAGLAGGSVEDTTGDPERPIRALGEAVERVAAAVEAARALPHPFVLTARADNFFVGVRDLDDTIRRLRAFDEAGADVLYAPGLPDAGAVRAVCAATAKPVNVLAAGPLSTSVAELGALGARRISLGAQLSRVAMTAVRDAIAELAGPGTFGATAAAAPFRELFA